MRLMISAVGTRGDVQPALALARACRARGHEVRMCLPPNFTAWAWERGFEAHAIGVEMRPPQSGIAAPPPAIADLIVDQFAVIEAVSVGCDLIVAAGVHQYAARSVAEARRIPSIIAVYSPDTIATVLPPPGHATPPTDPASIERLWRTYRVAWNARALNDLTAQRRRLGLRPVDDVLGHILGHDPWLAADALLAGDVATPGFEPVTTGAWIFADDSPLPDELEEFLESGEPPVYVGFGSMPTSSMGGDALAQAIRKTGHRAVIARGWADLRTDRAQGMLSIGDVNHETLFRRVAAVVHHGGAGTTTTAARAGVPQVVVPMFSDQFHWGRRVCALQIGVSIPSAALEPSTLARALGRALTPPTIDKAARVATQVRGDGANIAAARIEALYRT